MEATRLRLLVRWLQRAGWMACGVVLAAALFVVAEVRSRPDLETWHRWAPQGELDADALGDAGTLDRYLGAEQELFDEVADTLGDQQDSAYLNRYRADSPTNASRHPRDWNRTFELDGGARAGGALLLHGLSDSPYSMRALATFASERGYYALGLRMPGHGTVPAALREVSWRDWRAAVELGVRAVDARRGDGPLILFGYSNGAALALDYALRAIDDPELTAPDALVLLSPALAVSSMASLAQAQSLLSHLPGLGGLGWHSIVPEFDPYKFNSFPIEAAEQIWELTRQLDRRLRVMAEGDALDGLPRVLVYQSVADATVPGSVSLERLFGRLPAGRGELVLFDINRAAEIENLTQPSIDQLLPGVRAIGGGVRFGLTLVSNTSPASRALAAYTLGPEGEGSSEPIGLEWPAGTYSLSHVALPFPPEDPVYGLALDLGAPFPFGRLEPKGERGTLRVPMTLLTRLRYNPFFPYLTSHLSGFLADLDGLPAMRTEDGSGVAEVNRDE